MSTGCRCVLMCMDSLPTRHCLISITFRCLQITKVLNTHMPTKERILYAALDLIAEKGYDGMGVDLIAAKAGLKGPSLYKYYKGKQDIFNSLVELVTSHYEEGFGLNRLGEVPSSMDELIENAMEKIKFTMYDDIIQKTRRILSMEQFRSEWVAKLTSYYHLEKLQQIYAGIFAGLMEKGIIKKDDPEYLALEFVSPVSLLIHIHFYNRQTRDEKHLNDILEIINIRPGIKILDLGCGSGYLTFPIAKRNENAYVIGLDIVTDTLNRTMIKAREIDICFPLKISIYS